MIGPVIGLVGDLLAGSAERGDPWEQGLRDALVGAGMVDQQGARDLGRLRWRGRRAVIDDAGVELVAGGDGQPVDEAAAPTKADCADLAAAARLGKLIEYRHRVSNRIAEVELADHVARPVLVGRGAAGRRQEIDRHRPIPAQRDPPGNVAGVLVEPAVLVDDHDGRLERSCPRLRDIGLVATDQGLVARGQSLVAGRDDGGRGRVGGDRRDQRFGGGDAAGDGDHPCHESAPLHAGVREAVVECDRLLADVVGHAGCSWLAFASAISLPSISFARR